MMVKGPLDEFVNSLKDRHTTGSKFAEDRPFKRDMQQEHPGEQATDGSNPCHVHASGSNYSENNDFKRDTKRDGLVTLSGPNAEAHESPSSRLDTPAPYIGQVVLVESMNGQRSLAVIAGPVEDHPRAPPSRWLVLAGNRDSRWVRESRVVDWQPRCFTCRGQNWWWSPEVVVLCAICRSPAPDWRKAFEELADWTLGMLPDDPRLAATLAAIDGCDAAWLARDWGRFQRHALQVQLLVVSGEPGGLDEQQKWLEG